ncbi:4-alpha-glucanotransferase [Roseomonas sp. AR75]|uniref:4-alpha-glucanotransferase n=1 Tax=Roseomonas sp. AR75 TaxID=2562311 RepID=UPI0010C0ED2D|nr:4-alpha-glucanotransferase [Roseomonas sp. AR75]
MSGADDALLRLATLHGFEPQWQDFRGRHHHVGLDTLRLLLRAQGVDAHDPEAALGAALDEAARAPLPPRLTGTAGQHLHVALPIDCPPDQPIAWRIETDSGVVQDGLAQPVCDPRPVLVLMLPDEPGEARLMLGGALQGEAALTIAPRRCFQGPLESRRCWGLGVQIYGLRKDGDGGLGHYGALADAARAAARRGADALALSPVHALFAADAGHFSPYAPSSRTRLNGWLVDPGGMPEVAKTAALAAQLGIADALADAEAAPLVEYGAALPLRLRLLRALHAQFAAAHLHPPSAMGAEFLRFRQDGGTRLEDHAHFEALHAHHLRADPYAWDWRNWPAPMRDPRSTEVATFAAAHAEEVAFHVFLQWLATRQLTAAQRAARDSGMGIGLIADLAVGTQAGGSRAWSRTAALLEGVSIGAPPDQLNLLGQNWGLTTFAPTRLAAQGYAPFLDDLATAMSFAGGVRIDHVMGLARIWCVPDGARATEGAYLRFPVGDMMRLLAAESHKRQAVVVGEDLGTLPDGFRDLLVSTGLLGLRVLFFERENDGAFAPSWRYDSRAVATSTTHDMPTLAGWWRGADIGLRAGLGLLPEGQDEAAEGAARQRERDALWQRLHEEGGAEGDAPAGPEPRLGAAVARFLGRTPSVLAMLPIEDAILSEPQVNLPGTTDAHPNWRRRLPAPVPALLEAEPAVAILGALDAARREGGG